MDDAMADATPARRAAEAAARATGRARGGSCFFSSSSKRTPKEGRRTGARGRGVSRGGSSLIEDSFFLGRRPPGLPSRPPLAPAEPCNHGESSPTATDEGVIVYVEAAGEVYCDLPGMLRPASASTQPHVSTRPPGTNTADKGTATRASRSLRAVCLIVPCLGHAHAPSTAAGAQRQAHRHRHCTT